MRTQTISTLLALLLVTGATARAATFTAALRDASGRAAANAVVLLEPLAGTVPTPHAPVEAIIDQRHEAFLPLVVVVRKGGHVVFTNHDTTKHQVYSFSAIKQFQFVIGQGDTSAPVEFPLAGIAAIGCNIHDQMIAYVFVGQAPYAAVTDENGRVTISDVNQGRYHVAVWHPQMGINASPVRTDVEVKDATAHYDANLPFTIESTRGMSHMHMDY